MKGLYIDKYIENVNELTINHDLEAPEAYGNDVLVHVRAGGIGYPDYLHAQGKHQAKMGFPLILGIEVAGVVIKAGENSKFKLGDRVLGLGTQALADYTIMQEGDIFKIPDSLSFEQAASIPLNYPTNYISLFHCGQLKKGQWCVIHGGTGGLGLSAIQLCKIRGINVIATGTNNIKLKTAKAVGADHVLNIIENPTWWQKVNEITSGKGADMIYDPVGQVEKSLNCIKFEGRIVIVGFAAGKIEKINMKGVFEKNCSLVGMTIAEYMLDNNPIFQECYQSLFKWIESGELVPQMHDERLYLTDKDVRKAFDLIVTRKSLMKLVLTVNY